VVMKVTRTLSLSWACAIRMVPRLLVVAVLSIVLTFNYILLSLLHVFVIMLYNQ
jgi:hypothetical protein